MPKSLLLKIGRYILAAQWIARAYAYLLPLKTQLVSLLIKDKQTPVVVILSLGTKGHSYSAARAARRQGLKVLLVSEDPVLHELVHTTHLIKLDPLKDMDKVISRLMGYNVSGVAISIKHILLPAQAKIADAFGCISVGETSAYLCNNKFSWREALKNAEIPQPKFSLDRSELNDLRVVQKPQMGTGSKGVALIAPGESARADFLPTHDRSVGQILYFEEYVEGPQFDVEGVSKDGQHKVLSIIAEKYSEIDGEFPPKYFRFNPSLDETLEKDMIQSVFSILDASSIKNGAWHVEGRIKDGVFLPLDFANRMGYERFVSQASGVDFAALHLSAFIDGMDVDDMLKPSPLLQFFANTPSEQTHIATICREHPQNIFDVRLDPFRMSTIVYEGMVVLKADSDLELDSISAPLMNPVVNTGETSAHFK